jgi:hypothetical protein
MDRAPRGWTHLRSRPKSAMLACSYHPHLQCTHIHTSTSRPLSAMPGRFGPRNTVRKERRTRPHPRRSPIRDYPRHSCHVLRTPLRTPIRLYPAIGNIRGIHVASTARWYPPQPRSPESSRPLYAFPNFPASLDVLSLSSVPSATNLTLRIPAPYGHAPLLPARRSTWRGAGGRDPMIY